MKKIFVKIIIVAIMLVLAYTTVVNAFSFTASMAPNKTNVEESSEFIVTIKVSNLEVGDNGINTLSGYLKYDTEIFETITDSSIDGLNGWSPKFNSENGKIELTKMNFTKTDESVFQITFKTKSDVSGKSGVISYENIIASNNIENISATNISTTITVGNSGATNQPENTTNNNVSNTTNNATNNTPIVPIVPTNNTTTKNNTSTNSSTYKNVTNNTSEEDIPYTGVEDTAMYVMIVVLALAIIFYVKYQKINKDLK